MDVWGEGGCSKPSHFLSITYTSHSAPLLTVTPYCTNNYPTAPNCNSIAAIKKAAYLITSLLDLSSPTHLWDQSDQLLTTPPGSLFRGFNHLPGGGRQQDSHTCISLIKGIIMIVHKALVLNKVTYFYSLFSVVETLLHDLLEQAGNSTATDCRYNCMGFSSKHLQAVPF